jgi:hypothetical protein
MTALRVLLAGALALAAFAIPSVASAKFSALARAALAISSDTLAAPTAVDVKCAGSAQRATISWTATTDTYATGYVIYGSFGGVELSQSVPGRTTTSYSPSTAVPAGTVITMVSVYRNWTSARSVSVTAPNNCH